jgi:hypothetical protein
MKRFAVFFFIFCVACGHECKNYVIKEIHLVPAKLVGKDTSNPNGLPYVLMSFGLDFVNCKSVSMGEAMEGGLQGIEYPLTKISILDARGVDITDQFRGAGFRGDLIREATDSINEKSIMNNISLQQLMNNINANKRTESGSRLEFPRAFTTPKNVQWPLLFKMYFSNSDSLVQKLNYEESDIKTYVIH